MPRQGLPFRFSNTDGSGIGNSYTNRAAGGYAGEAFGDEVSAIEKVIGSSFRDFVGGGATAITFNLGSGDDVFDTNGTLTGWLMWFTAKRAMTRPGAAAAMTCFMAALAMTHFMAKQITTCSMANPGGDRLMAPPGIDTLDYTGSNASVYRKS